MRPRRARLPAARGHSVVRRWWVAGAVAVLVAACSSGSGPPRPAAQGVPHRAPLGVVRFVDVSAGTGLAGPNAVQSERRLGAQCRFDPSQLRTRFPHVVVAPSDSLAKDRCLPDRMSGGVAVGDFDGDGWPDVYLTRLDGPGVLYRNTRHGSFVDVTHRFGLDVLHEPSNGATFVDVDDDGRPDLFVTTLDGRRDYLFMNRGGRFHEEAIARGAAVADDDVHSGFSADVGDVNGDGYPDIRTTEWRLNEIVPSTRRSHTRLLLNRGAARPGYFVDVTEASGVGDDPRVPGAFGFASAITDIDGDGHADIVAVNDFDRSRIYWGDGHGHFVDGTRASAFGSDENGMGLTVGDYDGDGRPDIFVSSIYDTGQRCRQGACAHGTTGNRLYRNLGHRRFVDVTTNAGVRNGGWGWGAAFVDATNSGLLDLVMTSGVAFPWEPTAAKFAAGGMRFWRNEGNGQFSEMSRAAGVVAPGPGKGLAVFDYDRDGRTDILVVRDGDRPVLLHNESTGVGSWLVVQPRDRSGRATSFGATVTVVVHGRRTTMLVDSPTHFLGASPPDPRFGLGPATKVDEVIVHWPGARRTTVLHDVAVDRTLTIEAP